MMTRGGVSNWSQKRMTLQAAYEGLRRLAPDCRRPQQESECTSHGVVAPALLCLIVHKLTFSFRDMDMEAPQEPERVLENSSFSFTTERTGPQAPRWPRSVPLPRRSACQTPRSSYR